jgi:hypothetical protein
MARGGRGNYGVIPAYCKEMPSEWSVTFIRAPGYCGLFPLNPFPKTPSLIE